MNSSQLLHSAQRLKRVVDWSRKSSQSEATQDDLDGAIVLGGAFRQFGQTPCPFMPAAATWNSPAGWRQSYGQLAMNFYAFGENFLGNQFAEVDGSVKQFMAETAAVVDLKLAFADWIDRAFTDPESEFSSWLLEDWNDRNGALLFDHHLCAKLPFVLGGSGSVDNPFALARDKSMAAKGDLAKQVHGLQSGAKVKLRVI